MMDASEDIIEVIDTKITDKWGVEWNEMETVRDFLQNFYDDNDVEDINIEVTGKTVKVSAPKTFHYLELIYLGSDKSNSTDKIGKYGEGWKASLLNAMRNFKCTVEIQIEDKRLVFYFKDTKIGETVKRVIMCNVLKAPFIQGTSLVIGNCSNKIIKEFQFGLSCFYYDKNPLIGQELAATYDKQILILKSTDDTGYIFYNRLLRSRIDAPVVIVCNKPYTHVETKIKHDRDRKAFNEEVQASLLKYVCRNVRGVKNVVEYMKDFWGTGHKLLNHIADANRRSNIGFPENYYAKNVSSDFDKNNFELSMEVEKIIKELDKLGYIACPHYMAYLGMKTPYSLARKKMDQKLTRHLESSSRDLILPEQNAVSLLLDFVKRFSVGLYNKTQGYKYIIGDNQDIVNDLKKAKAYDDKKIFLSKAFYTYNFEDALIALITNFSEQYEIKSGSFIPDFHISLITALLKEEGIIATLKKYESNWKETTNKIVEEAGFITIKSSKVDKDKRREELTELYLSGRIEDLIGLLKQCKFKDKNTERTFLILCEQYNSWQRDNIRGLSDAAMVKEIKIGFLEIVRESEYE